MRTFFLCDVYVTAQLVYLLKKIQSCTHLLLLLLLQFLRVDLLALQILEFTQCLPERTTQMGILHQSHQVGHQVSCILRAVAGRRYGDATALYRYGATTRGCGQFRTCDDRRKGL